MQEERYQDLVPYLADQSAKLLDAMEIKIGVGPIDYVAIRSGDIAEYQLHTEALRNTGVLVEQAGSGEVYQLYEPIETEHGPVSLVRARRPVPDEFGDYCGYVDYRPSVHYDQFLEIYRNRGTLTQNRDGIRMLLIEDSNYDAYVYFPELPLGEELENHQTRQTNLKSLK